MLRILSLRALRALVFASCMAGYVPEVFPGGCTGSNFSYTVNSINYCTNTVCITFSGYATGLHGNETFCWNWGDGSPQTCDSPNLSGNQSYIRSACKTYNLSGTYNISLNVTPAHSTCLVEREISFQNTDYTWDVTCAGNGDGCINFEPNPNVPSLVYKWSNGSTTQDVCNLSPGNYTLTVTDANGCSITENFTILDPAPVNINVDNTNCSGGSANITVTGGTPPNPNPNPFFENFNTMPDGSTSSGADQRWTSGNPGGGTWDRWQVIGGEWNGYSLDNEAFWETGCIDVKYCNNNRVSLKLAKKCDDANSNDYVRVFYSCNGGAETQIINPVVNQISNYPTYCTFQGNIPNCTGCLKVVVRIRRPHSGGTCNTNSITSGPCAPASSSSSTTTTTTTTTGGGGGGADQDDNRHEIYIDDVSVTCTPTNPPPYTYLWCNGSTNEDITNIPPGTSTCCVTATDGNGCTNSTCIQCCTLVLTTSKTDVSCFGGSDGTGTVTISAGAPAYNYVWSNSTSSSNTTGTVTATGLTAGTYTVTVTGSDGCERIETIIITEPPALTRTLTPVHILCAGDGNGSVSVTAGGGTPGSGYTYNWSAPGGNGTSMTGLNGGNYTVTVTDSKGCTITGSTTVNEPPPMTISASPDQTICPQTQPSATITVTSGGGTGGHTYSWSNGGSGTSQTVSPTITTTYIVTATDANGCTITDQVTIFVSCFPVVTLNPDSFCIGGCADIIANASGGQPNYTYTWNPAIGSGAGPHNVCPTATTTYRVTVTDQNGDTASATTTVTVFNPPVPTTSHQDATCGQCDGSVSVTATGSSPFTYNWSSGCTTATCTAMCPGTYNVTVTDKNGCTATASEPVNNLGAPSITADSTDVSCNGACDGTATVTLTVQGTPPYNYLWSNGCTATTCTSLCAGPYSVTITDLNNCQAIATTVVNEPPPLAVTPSATDEICGNCQGTASASPSGGIPGYTYLWGNGEITQSISGLCAGNYPVTITDATGCVITTSATVNNQLILPTADFVSNPIEVTIFNPTVNFTDKSSGAISWYWTFGDGDTSVLQHPIHTYQDTGCYPVTLHIVNQYGCEDDINGVVCVKDISSIYIPNAFTPNGDGTNDWFTVKEYNYCEFEMYIFDRWGNLIYETTSLKGWDGTANGGSEIVQEDVYVWLVKARDCYDELWKRIGQVTVVK